MVDQVPHRSIKAFTLTMLTRTKKCILAVHGGPTYMQAASAPRSAKRRGQQPEDTGTEGHQKGVGTGRGLAAAREYVCRLECWHRCCEIGMDAGEPASCPVRGGQTMA